MLYEKIKLFFVKNKAIRFTLIILLTIAFVYLLGFAISKYYPKMSDTTKGTVGTLLGAVVGGGFTLYGSIAINKKAQKASNAIKRKNLIYKPLYDELMLIHTEILKDNPYPGFIVFEKGQQTMYNHPQYTVWGRIEKDTRYFEAPQKLISAMDELYNSIHLYQKDRSAALNDLDCLYRKHYSKFFGRQIAPQANVGDSLISYVLEEKCPQKDLLLWFNENVDDTVANVFWKNLLIQAKYRPEYRRTRKDRQKWENAEDYVIELLAVYIQYINAKYEG